MNVLIVANGIFSDEEISIPPNTEIIAADGGARHCLARHIFPHVVIGDFDSLTAEETAILARSGTIFVRHPADKDETDLELALTYALESGATHITLFGLLGARWDMSFANIMLLASPRYEDLHFHLIDGQTEMFILRSEQTLELKGSPGDKLSVIPFSPKASGITYNGLTWPLVNATLHFGSPRGVSNSLAASKAQIQLKLGTLLVILIHKTDRPSE